MGPILLRPRPQRRTLAFSAQGQPWLPLESATFRPVTSVTHVAPMAAVQGRDGECRIATEVLLNVAISVSLDDRKQDPTPELGAVAVATPQHGPFKIAVLVEQEQ